MDQRSRMQSLMQRSGPWDYRPAAFFTHFGSEYRDGSAAAARHVEFFNATGMDFAKVQFEHTYPQMPEIKRPEDWSLMPKYDVDFYGEALRVIEGVVAQLSSKALVIATIYSPFMCAGHATSDELVTEHLKSNPQVVADALHAITESLSLFIRRCAEIGVDGFYIATQGGEAGRFDDPSTFDRYVLPTDLAIGGVANEVADFNILHICDYMASYDSIDRFVQHPAHVVSLPYRYADGTRIDLQKAYQMFDRPILGGLDRSSSIWSDSEASFREHVKEVLDMSPEQFILGADCTVSPQVSWERLAVAIETAHSYAGGKQ